MQMFILFSRLTMMTTRHHNARPVFRYKYQNFRIRNCILFFYRYSTRQRIFFSADILIRMALCRSSPSVRLPDQPWSWLVCMVATLSLTILMGLAWSYSVFLAAFMDRFDNSIEELCKEKLRIRTDLQSWPRTVAGP